MTLQLSRVSKSRVLWKRRKREIALIYKALSATNDGFDNPCLRSIRGSAPSSAMRGLISKVLSESPRSSRLCSLRLFRHSVTLTLTERESRIERPTMRAMRVFEGAPRWHMGAAEGRRVAAVMFPLEGVVVTQGWVSGSAVRTLHKKIKVFARFFSFFVFESKIFDENVRMEMLIWFCEWLTWKARSSKGDSPHYPSLGDWRSVPCMFQWCRK